MDISLVKQLLREAHQLILKYKNFLYLYLFLGFSAEAITFLTTAKMISSSYVFVAFFITLENIAIIYALPYSLLAREEGKKSSYKEKSAYLFHTLARIFFPFFLLFLFIGILVLLLTHGKVANLSSHYSGLGLGFFPSTALLYSFITFLFSQALFSPIFFSLKNQSVVKSFLSSTKLYWKDISFALPLSLLPVIANFLLNLFIAKGSPLIVLLILPFEYLSLLIGITSFLYYKKKYSLPSFAEVERKQAVIKRNVVLRRISAFLIDSVLLFLYFIYVGSLLGDTISGSMHPSWLHADTGLWIVLLVAFIYPILGEWLVGGTIGKLLCGIRVVTVTGEPITFWQSLVRNLFRFIDAFPYTFPYIVGLIAIAASEKKQRLGDMVARTMVIVKE